MDAASFLPLSIGLLITSTNSGKRRFCSLQDSAAARWNRKLFFYNFLLPKSQSSTKAVRTRMAIEGTRTAKIIGASMEEEAGVIGNLSRNRVLVGCGGAALDFLATVDSFPKPDDKMRSTESQVLGGGNVGNALTAAARLGLDCRIFTKVANDGSGSQILSELQADGIDTSNVVVAEEGVSPFTYVIVDKETSTRTCIHTPGFPPLEPHELTPAIISTLLCGANLVYFDGRLTDTALLLAEQASLRQLPILVDSERLREGMDELLAYADYVVASSNFPQSWTGAPTVPEALVRILLRLPRLKFVIVTLGGSGCIMLERHYLDSIPIDMQGEVLDVNVILEELLEKAVQLRHLPPSVVSSSVRRLGLADSGDSKAEIFGRFLVGTAEAIPASELVDTTGAGDGFIGGVMYSLLAGLTPEKMLALGAIVAGGSCRALGARPGLPNRMEAKVASYL